MRSRGETDELAQLMKRVASGDQDAFAGVYDATSRIVFGVVLRVLADRAQAEEVTQEVYVTAWQQATRFDATRGSVTGWLTTIAHRKAVDRTRSAARSRQRDLQHASSEPAAVLPDVSDVVVGLDEGRRVRAALRELPPHQREALELAYFEGLTHREVAERLGIPLGTAKTRIRDALIRLRHNIGEASR
jgi:RNA polymerase sigma-70 factor (ECF subfamily)